MTIVPSSSRTLRGMPKALRASNATFLVREAKRASVEPLAQHAVLGFQVLNNDELLTADPTGEQEHDESEWRRFELHP